MVDSTSKDEATTTPRPTGDVSKLYDAVNENCVKTVDELAKVQPKYGQSIHNAILAQIHTVKNVIRNTILAQKQLTSGWNLPVAYSEQFVKESDEITKNMVNAIDVNNEVAVKSLDAITENFKTFNRTIDSFTEFNINAAKTWNSLYSAQQQQFLKQ
ncbi:MAG: hypothetical protein FIO02_12815 [Nitrosopumilales archaeon]|nr:hypothetical protein [Nitrosopumilales archaeon]